MVIYQFVLTFPYGQKGQPITLTAEATERREVNARSAFSSAVELQVNADTVVPELTIITPQANATVTEGLSFAYRLDATDNVKVTAINTELGIDKNSNGKLESNEVIAQNFLGKAPYNGSFKAPHLDSLGVDTDSVTALLVATVNDGAGNQSIATRSIRIKANTVPNIDAIELIDQNGLLFAEPEIVVGRTYKVQVRATDVESGIDKVTLYKAIGSDTESAYTKIGEDQLAPFSFEDTSTSLEPGSKVFYRAVATDIQGLSSLKSEPYEFTIVADQPPEVEIVQPSQAQSFSVSGEPIEVFARVKDDLGVDGIDRVVFLLNEQPVEVVRIPDDSLSNLYRALVHPPVDASGVTIQVIAYDSLNQQGVSQPVNVGILTDTVKPEIQSVYPVNGEILDVNKPIISRVLLKDIGSSGERGVTQTWTRQYQGPDGLWVTLAEVSRELLLDDQGLQSHGFEPGNRRANEYVYWSQFSDGNILSDQNHRNERVKLTTEVVASNHSVKHETFHEVSLPIKGKTYFAPNSQLMSLGQTVYYSSLAQHKDESNKQSN